MRIHKYMTGGGPPLALNRVNKTIAYSCGASLLQLKTPTGKAHLNLGTISWGACLIVGDFWPGTNLGGNELWNGSNAYFNMYPLKSKVYLRFSAE